MLTPFVFELRTAIDWVSIFPFFSEIPQKFKIKTWTDTSMPIFDFFNMENFYAVIYNLKCARTFEQAFPAPRGEAKGPVIKYMMGLPFIIVLILLVWSPIIAFALINTIGKVQSPDSVTLTAGLEGYPVSFRWRFLLKKGNHSHMVVTPLVCLTEDKIIWSILAPL